MARSPKYMLPDPEDRSAYEELLACAHSRGSDSGGRAASLSHLLEGVTESWGPVIRLRHSRTGALKDMTDFEHQLQLEFRDKSGRKLSEPLVQGILREGPDGKLRYVQEVLFEYTYDEVDQKVDEVEKFAMSYEDKAKYWRRWAELRAAAPASSKVGEGLTFLGVTAQQWQESRAA